MARIVRRPGMPRRPRARAARRRAGRRRSGRSMPRNAPRATTAYQCRACRFVRPYVRRSASASCEAPCGRAVDRDVVDGPDRSRVRECRRSRNQSAPTACVDRESPGCASRANHAVERPVERDGSEEAEQPRPASTRAWRFTAPLGEGECLRHGSTDPRPQTTTCSGWCCSTRTQVATYPGSIQSSSASHMKIRASSTRSSTATKVGLGADLARAGRCSEAAARLATRRRAQGGRPVGPRRCPTRRSPARRPPARAPSEARARGARRGSASGSRS